METIDLGEGATLIFEPNFIVAEQSGRYFEELRDQVTWEQKPGLFGHMQPRLIASQGNSGVSYRYSGLDYAAASWSRATREIKEKIERITGCYNYCLLNRYRSGSDSMGWHADDEPELGDTIASVSLGATRKFRMRHNTTGETRSLALESGSLVVMAGTMQKLWKHEIPKTKLPVGERINLTYRMVTRRS